MVGQQPSHDPGRLVDGARCEDHTTFLHKRAAADEFANLGRVGVVELRRRKRIGFEPGDQIAVGQDVGRAGGPGPCPIDGAVVERLEHGSLELVEWSNLESEIPCVRHGLAEFVDGGAQGGGIDRPPADVRRSEFAGESAQVVDVDAAPFTDHPLDVAIGFRPRRRNDRIDVEDLAAAERDTLTRLAEDEAVAGHEREADRQMHPDRSGGSRFDRIGAEHANANGMLA